MAEKHTDIGQWIADIKTPYETVVGGTNTPPQSLTSLAQTTAGNREGLVKLYKELDESQREFDSPPAKFSQSEIRTFHDINPVDRNRNLRQHEQLQKWFVYPKVRILAAFEKFFDGLPDRDAVENAECIHDDLEPFELPEDELELISTLDTNAALDSTNPDQLLDQLRRDEGLAEFVTTVYADHRDLRGDILSLDRAGVKFGILEVYNHRIDFVEEIPQQRIEEIGADSFSNQVVSAETLQDERHDIERQIGEQLEATVGGRLETIEAELQSMETATDRAASPSDDIAGLEREISKLRQDMQQWTLGEASDLQSVTARLNSLVDELDRAFQDERFASQDALTTIRMVLQDLRSDVNGLPEDIEARMADLYEEDATEALGHESYTEDKPALQEMAMLMMLANQLNDLSDPSE
jgi:hypothetical protein